MRSDNEAARRLARELARPTQPAPVRYGTVISTDPASGVLVLRPSTAALTDGSQDIPARYLTHVAPAVGSVVRFDVVQGDVLVLGSPTLDGYPAAPFAMASGLATTPAGGSIAVSFPASRFTVAPLVTLGVVANAMPGSVVAAYASTPTTSGFTLRVNSGSAPAGGAGTVAWSAVQMTSTTAAG